MAGKKRTIALTLRALARQRVDYEFTPAEHTGVYEEILLNPGAILAVCLEKNIVLGELLCYQRMCISHPDLARDVADQARAMGVLVSASAPASLPNRLP